MWLHFSIQVFFSVLAEKHVQCIGLYIYIYIYEALLVCGEMLSVCCGLTDSGIYLQGRWWGGGLDILVKPVAVPPSDLFSTYIQRHSTILTRLKAVSMAEIVKLFLTIFVSEEKVY